MDNINRTRSLHNIKVTYCLYAEESMKLVTKYFKCDTLIEFSLSNGTSSNELFFNFLANSFVITVSSDFK